MCVSTTASKTHPCRHTQHGSSVRAGSSLAVVDTMQHHDRRRRALLERLPSGRTHQPSQAPAFERETEWPFFNVVPSVLQMFVSSERHPRQWLSQKVLARAVLMRGGFLVNAWSCATHQGKQRTVECLETEWNFPGVRDVGNNC